jgi:putative endonuclease
MTEKLSPVKAMRKGGYVYIMCNRNNTTLYVGVTSVLGVRIVQHKESFYPKSFTARYNCTKLVYYKWFDTIIDAIAEEKRIKGGSRKQKELLINTMNPGWNDLYEQARLL